ncbi:zinc ribbon domain-containing protein [Candidatus Ozemobacteraceae bacterium]|nr:zinc ribbon domain-containing protein [Candidatus Ozemobacteraceae bacterium]
MPMYEYRCDDCRKTFSMLCKISERVEQPPCEHCSSTRTRRLVSKFRTVRSEDQILESMADPSALSGIDENDPRSIARWAKKMAREMGEDMGDEIEAMAEEEIAKVGRGEAGDTAGPEDAGMPALPPVPASGEE